MENWNPYYIEPNKIVVEKQDEEMDFDVEYVPELEIEANSSAQDYKDMASQGAVISKTKTQVILETQDVGNTQTIPETQIGIIVLD